LVEGIGLVLEAAEILAQGADDADSLHTQAFARACHAVSAARDIMDTLDIW